MRSRLVYGVSAGLFFVSAMLGWLLFSARNSAENSIEQAEAAITKAQPAEQAGSPVETDFNTAQTLLTQARDEFAAGSIFSRGSNNYSKELADEADGLAQKILDDLAQAYNDATNEVADQKYDKAFAFYKQYPATDEANELMGEVQGAFKLSIYFNSTKIDESISTFEKIATFFSIYPAGKPEIIVQQTGNYLVDAAFGNIADLETLYDQNAASANAMESSYAAQNFQTMPQNIPSSAMRIQQLLPGLYMPDEMQMLFGRLLEADNLALEYESILGPPGNKLSEADISNLVDLNQRMNAKIAEAKSALDAVERKYYPGSNPAYQKGFEEGRKNRPSHAGT